MEYPTLMEGYFEDDAPCPECGGTEYVVNLEKIQCCSCGIIIKNKEEYSNAKIGMRPMR
ncbi:MAG: hypothetical protein ACW97P_13555 [Candidatus Hodarchaeales archaeon]|jgi:transcription initiation factor TFIIIB Brf1 subunit/transcription initiation factor TFIIB